MNVNEKHKGFSQIGDYIEEQFFRVGYDNPVEISGINIGKGFIPTVANMNGIDTSKYKLVPHNYFACNLMHIGRDITIPLAYNRSHENIAISPAYYTFHIKEEKKDAILPEYLEMILTREEFGRLAWFHTDASIRGNLPERDFKDILIPVPQIDIQQELVDVYNGLKKLTEQNEALIGPLSKVCEAMVIDCKSRYSEVTLGEYIELCDERNKNNIYTAENLKGVTNEGIFEDSRANTMGLDFSNYKVVKYGEFTYNPSRINLGSIALNKEVNYIVSPMYCNFRIKTEKANILLPEYLNIWFRRREFQRSTLFYATGSVRDTFDFELMCNVKIPLPSKEVQKTIIDIYHCLEESKKIASEAREKLKMLCPALVQKAANS